MAFKPKQPCFYPGCPKLVDGRYCEYHKKLSNSQYNKYQRDPNSKKRYGGRWKKIRNIYISKNPLCERCKKLGKLTNAQEVHHIIPLSMNGTHNEDNLMSLCTACHRKITANGSKNVGRGVENPASQS